jgi:hypothetical protein
MTSRGSCYSSVFTMTRVSSSNAQVQLQARYNHFGEAASEKCLSAAMFVRHGCPSPPKLF